MKLKAYFIAALAAVALSACNEDFGTGIYQTPNEQGALASFTALTATSVEPIDFADLNDSTKSVQVCTLVPPTYTVGNFDITYEIFLNRETTGYKLNSKGEMSYDELKAYVESTYGRRPINRDITAVVRAYLKSESGSTHIDSKGFTITCAPEAPIIEESYFYIGSSNGWSSTDQSYQLSNGGGDVYENPVFTVVIPATFNDAGNQEDNWFKIAPLSAYSRDDFWNGDMVGVEVNGTSDLTGSLVVGQNDEVANAWKIDAAANPAKFYRISVNMLDQTYEIVPLNFSEYFYEIGNESGWSTSHPLYGENYDGKYRGFYYLNGEFKFKPNADNWDNDLEYVSEGVLTESGGPNVPDPGAGFYMIDLDAAAYTYALTKVESIGIIGGFNSWGGDEEMTYNVEGGYWEATVTFDSDTEYKFRMNHDWAVNWGGTLDNLTHNGANLNASAGTYNIKLYLGCVGTFKAEVTPAN